MNVVPLQALTAATEAIAPYFASDDSKAQLAAAKCHGLMVAYHRRWQHQDYRVIGAEEVLTSKLRNPETGKQSQTFAKAGKLDVRVLDANGRSLVIDHKTTSMDFSDPSAPYWKHLVVQAQPMYYLLLEWENGRKSDGAVWDVVRKPGISPRLLTKGDAQTFLNSASYLGLIFDGEEVEAFSRTLRETPRMYAARVTKEATDDPERFFARRFLARVDFELLEMAGENWAWGQEILLARRHNRWGKSPEACFQYNTPCKYLGICSNHDDPESKNWVRKSYTHSELPVIDGVDGRNVLTNSSLACFRACRRKYFHAYEMGIERADENDRESILIGNIFHAAQEAWWSAIQKQQEKTHGCFTGSEGIEPSSATVPASISA